MGLYQPIYSSNGSLGVLSCRQFDSAEYLNIGLSVVQTFKLNPLGKWLGQQSPVAKLCLKIPIGKPAGVSASQYKRLKVLTT